VEKSDRAGKVSLKDWGGKVRAVVKVRLGLKVRLESKSQTGEEKPVWRGKVRLGKKSQPRRRKNQPGVKRKVILGKRKVRFGRRRRRNGEEFFAPLRRLLFSRINLKILVAL
jgi:hypothetical protein